MLCATAIAALVPAAASGDSMELRVEVAGLGLDARPGDLTQNGARPHVAALHRTLHAFTTTLLVCRAQPGPRARCAAVGKQLMSAPNSARMAAPATALSATSAPSRGPAGDTLATARGRSYRALGNCRLELAVTCIDRSGGGKRSRVRCHCRCGPVRRLRWWRLHRCCRSTGWRVPSI